MLYFQLLHVGVAKIWSCIEKITSSPSKVTLIFQKKKKEFYISTDLYNLKSIEILGIYTWSIQLEVYKH